MERRRGSLISASSAGPIDLSNPNPNYLTIVALEDGLTASLSTNNVEYSIDGNDNWATLTADTISPVINKDHYISFRGNLTPASFTGVGTFTISKSCNLTGNCNSLLFGDSAADNLDLTGKDYAFYRLFYNCTTIKNVSSNFLPATTLAYDCYYYMFYGCTSLTTAPELPATTLANACYEDMFQGCTSLTTAPELPATTLARSCYSNMFSGCSSLTTAPKSLPATTLSDFCYSQMFNGCTSLTTAPTLPATTLAHECYREMFHGCTSLTTAPQLPATTLKTDCYYHMFSGTNVLPDCSNINFSSSTVVASGGLNGLFAGTKITDSDLRSILPINSNGKYYLPCTTLAIQCYTNMFSGCSSLTTAPELPATTLASGCYEDMFQGCTSLTTAPELPATTLASRCYNSMFYNCTSLTTAPELPATTLASQCYTNMFSGCSSLTTAPKSLPATTLAYECYRKMFYGCSSLTTAPGILPATTLADYCYSQMFNGCTSLTTAPTLPATTLAYECYKNMFNGCSKLTTAPELPATTLSDFCYSNMFYNCTSLTTAPGILPATTLANACYSQMFNGCTSLTTAPELPATTLASSCYSYMFYGCSKLNYIKAMFTTTPSSSYTSSWVSGVASSGTFIKSKNATWNVTGTSGIPSGWTVDYAWTPQTCVNLAILADNVSNGNQSTTTIHYTALCQGVDENGVISQETLTGDEEVEIGQNKTTSTVQKTVSFTYLNKTATTTITQGPWVDASYTVNLNSQWQKSSTISNPNTSTYDGVYESYSNKGTNSSGASMYIDINGYTNFKLYIRSYAESNYDYVMVSQLDKTLTYNSSYSDTTLVKAHTRGNQKSGTTINDYTLVEFTDIPSGSHRIQIIYRKDSSANSGDDRGYVLIHKNQ